MYRLFAAEFENIGITAYLFRTANNLDELIKYNGKIRLVKGAFETKRGLSLPREQELDTIYLRYADLLLQSDHRCSIATHDPKIQHSCKEFFGVYTAKNYKFESIYIYVIT